jgi:hypothetical protein
MQLQYVNLAENMLTGSIPAGMRLSCVPRIVNLQPLL